MNILVCDPIDEACVNLLREAGFHVDLKTSINKQELADIVGTYDAIIIRSRTTITKEILQQGKPKLKVVARSGVGLDNVDTDEAERLSIQVVNSAEAPSNAVAELVIGYMLILARNLTKADASVKRCEWIKNKLTGFEISGKTVGIVGFGHIGYLVCKKAKALGMRVLVYDIIMDKQFKLISEVCAEPTSLEKLLKESDFVTVHVPLLPDTKYMFNETTIGEMKKGSYIINAARGGVIDEKALIKALKSGHLAGAALDVYEEEPTKNVELITMENVICTPHIGSESREAQKMNGIIIAEKLVKLLGK